MMSSPAAGEVEALIKNNFILDVKGLDRWPDLKRLPNFQKQLIRKVVVFQANRRDNSILFITSEDEVYGVGYNGQDTNILGLTGQYFQCEKVEHPVRVEDLTGKEIKVISAGDYIAAAIDGEGSLFWWGNCGGEGSEIMPPHSACKNPTVKLISISCGSRYLAAISHDNKVFVWGAKYRGGKKLGVYEHIIKITSGKTHLAMLTDQGEVYLWNDDNNQTESPVDASCRSVDKRGPYDVRKVQFNQICKDIACGFSTTLCLSSSGDVWACGGNSKPWGLAGDSTESTKVEKLTMRCKVSKLMVGWGNSNGIYQSMYIAIATDGQKQVWYDSDGPRFLNNSPTIDLFFETITPRDIMYTILYPHPHQYCVKCVSCQSSYNMKHVSDQMQKKLDVISEIIAEIVRDLKRATAQQGGQTAEATITKLNSINELVKDKNSVTTQTELIQDTRVT